MNDRYLKLLSLGFCFSLSFAIPAQNSILGKVNNWTDVESIIAYFGMFNGEMILLGSINTGGDLQIPLDPDYFNIFKKMAEKEADEAPPGWIISYNTMATTFPCMFEESIATQNGLLVMSDSLIVV